jgi:hypothetical protein
MSVKITLGFDSQTFSLELTRAFVPSSSVEKDLRRKQTDSCILKGKTLGRWMAIEEKFGRIAIT